MTPSHVDPATNAILIRLLQQWSRARVTAAISQATDPVKALQDGVIEAQLARQPRRRHKLKAHATNDASSNGKVVGMFDAHFPELLRHIPDPPLVLYYQGNLELLQRPSVAIVGARKCTTQGASHARKLAHDLVENGLSVVSGLALGIDAAAHRGALQGRGLTAAFLGAGLSNLYPRQHHQLATQIIECNGLLVSEYPTSVTPRPYQFPERNRLISGASLATIVVEASTRSGSLITARFAAEQGRDVMALPGSVQSHVSGGCHRLIQEGAGLVTKVEDVLANLGLERHHISAPAQRADLSAHGVTILELMCGYALGVDEIIAKTGLEHAVVAQALVELELAAFVEQSPLGYIRTA